MYLRRLVSPHIWKRACTTLAAPAGVETSAAAPVATGQRGKRKILDKFRYLTVETVDLILREEEKKGISVTQAELVRWAKRLGNTECRHRNALAIFEWMEKKKMTFSPSELALYVEFIAKVKGLDAAQDYFDKVDPNFDNLDPNSKNMPAYMTIYDLAEDAYERNPNFKRHVIITPLPHPRHGDRDRDRGGK